MGERAEKRPVCAQNWMRTEAWNTGSGEELGEKVDSHAPSATSMNIVDLSDKSNTFHSLWGYNSREADRSSLKPVAWSCLAALALPPGKIKNCISPMR